MAQLKKNTNNKVQRLGDIDGHIVHTPTGFPSFDLLNNGGLVTVKSKKRGDYTHIHLFGAAAGLGKSTYLLQVLAAAGDDWMFSYEFNEDGQVTGVTDKKKKKKPLRSLYIANEEDISIISARAQRLGVNMDNVFAVSCSFVEDIPDLVKEVKPHIIGLDSVQGLKSNKQGQRGWSRGSSKMLQYVEEIFTEFKEKGIFTLMIGQVTKSGQLAGTNNFQHMIDATCRMKRGKHDPDARHIFYDKNRGGAVTFEMYHKMGPNGFNIGTMALRDDE